MNDDLISRKALLKAMEEERQYLLNRGLTGAEHILVHHCLPLIDNAPTVDTTFREVVAYECGQKSNDRPQGEWIELKTNPPEFFGHKFYICSLCNREIDIILPEGSLNDYPFCHCGADMRGKEEENDS